MKIKTTRFGTIDIEEEKIINMPHGMPGFPNQRQFVLMPHKENSPFFWYQAVEEPTLAFVLMSPFLVVPDYQLDVDDVVEKMSWKEEEGDLLELYVVVNIPKGAAHKMTANLIGPILINNKARQAVQLIIPDSNYPHKYPLVQENTD